MQSKHKNKDIILVALSDEPASKVGSFVKDNKMNYIVGADAKTTFKAFGIKAYPTVFVIDAGGKIAYRGHDIEEAVNTAEKAVKNKPEESSGGGLEDAAAKKAYDKALKLYKKKDYVKAMKAFQEVAKDFEGSEPADKAKEKLKKMKASKAIMEKIREAKSTKQCEEWLDMARMLARNGKTDQAVEYYQKIVDKYPDTSFAEIARKEMIAL